MSIYSIQFVASAAKEFRSLPEQVKTQVHTIIEKLNCNPFSLNICKLRGHEHLYRIRAGQYRIVFEMHNADKLILITRIRHRREAYR